MTYRWPDQDWKDLVIRFVDGRQPCNCGEAWYKNCGEVWLGEDDLGRPIKRYDYPTCEYGCSANLIRCKQEIATRVVALLEKL